MSTFLSAVALKLLGPFAALTVAATIVDTSNQLNVLLNAVTLIVAVGVAVPALKSRRKDSTIKDLTDALEAKTKLTDALHGEVNEMVQQKRQIEQAATHCRDETTEWRAKYEEAQKYTAANALDTVMQILQQNDQGHERRHQEIMKSLDSLTVALRRE